MIKKTIKLIKLLINILLILFYIWCIPAIYFIYLPHPIICKVLTISFVIIVPLLILFAKGRLTGLIFPFLLCIIVLIRFLLISPSNDRHWKTDVAKQPKITFNGNYITIENIRDFQYETAETYKIRYYNKTFNLNNLSSLDYILSYWDGNTLVAHSMLSFGFKDGEYLCVSVETRLEQDEPQSGLRGIYNQYEVIYILASENDLLRLRTNFRKENVFLYRFKLPKHDIKKIFLSVLHKAHKLESKPEFYNTLHYNCLKSLLDDVRNALDLKRSYNIMILMNGKSDELGYNKNLFMNQRLPFEEFKQRHHVNQYIKDKMSPEEYSKAIRTDLLNN